MCKVRATVRASVIQYSVYSNKRGESVSQETPATAPQSKVSPGKHLRSAWLLKELLRPRRTAEFVLMVVNRLCNLVMPAPSAGWWTAWSAT